MTVKKKKKKTETIAVQNYVV